jgi:two-component system CheB/CheR fusion protein
MLLLEEAEAQEGLAPRIQIFASDLHEQSLEFAREGFYPGDIASEVSADRLKRYFIQEPGGYRIRPEVRKAIVFAPHNVLADPPFSKLDLIVCRNLLIYLQRDVQDDVLQIFHYALKPGGYLVLGTAETVDEPELFRPVDKPNSIHLRSKMPLPEPRLPCSRSSTMCIAETAETTGTSRTAKAAAVSRIGRNTRRCMPG